MSATLPTSPSFAHPKSRRVHKRTEYLEIQAQCARVHTPHFVLLLSLDVDRSRPARLGVTVTRKVGDAVRRNRFKRVVRECFRLEPAFLPPGVRLIAIAKDGGPTLDLAGVQREWQLARPHLLRRVRDLEARAAKPASTAK